jgi:hypothetical protein
LTLVVVQLSSELVRVAVVHNTEEDSALLSRAVQTILSSQSSLESVLTVVQTLLGLPDPIQEPALVEACRGILGSVDDVMELLYGAETNYTMDAHTRFSRTVVGLEAGQNAMLSNGKVSNGGNRCSLVVLTSSVLVMRYCSLVV